MSIKPQDIPHVEKLRKDTPSLGIKMDKSILFILSVCSIFFSNVAQSIGTKTEVLLKTIRSWDGILYTRYPTTQPEISILKITIPAHTKLDWHTHPMPNAAYVISGALTVEKENGEKKYITQGDVLAETVNSVHRGITGKLPVTLIVFYAGTPGMPFSKPKDAR